MLSSVNSDDSTKSPMGESSLSIAAIETPGSTVPKSQSSSIKPGVTETKSSDGTSSTSSNNEVSSNFMSGSFKHPASLISKSTSSILSKNSGSDTSTTNTETKNTGLEGSTGVQSSDSKTSMQNRRNPDNTNVSATSKATLAAKTVVKNKLKRVKGKKLRIKKLIAKRKLTPADMKKMKSEAKTTQVTKDKPTSKHGSIRLRKIAANLLKATQFVNSFARQKSSVKETLQDKKKKVVKKTKLVPTQVLKRKIQKALKSGLKKPLPGGSLPSKVIVISRKLLDEKVSNP